ncbi:MAG: hypothetical protein GY749_42335 [Desulfobacteraceae bacterium]|nr:hypothetical protein [Desulfobacteraceae bacterium]
MDIDTKLAALGRILKIYDDFAGKLDTACKRYCSQCCTRNVTLTTLEGYSIAEHLVSNEKSELFEIIKNESAFKRFKPEITTNRLADYCIQGKDIPDEDSDSEGSCPFLQDNECPVYQVRPFGCRCFVSYHNCREHGYAYTDPFVLTVNNVFLQYIEHIDASGYSGNLTDVLLFMESQENRRKYKTDILQNPNNGLIQNYPLKVLMIPPEHRQRIRPVIEAIVATP